MNLDNAQHQDECDNEDSDDDRSNNGLFEFSAVSRRIYQAKSSHCEAVDFSSLADEANALSSEAMSFSSSAVVSLNQIQRMQPRPVSKRSVSGQSMNSNDSIQDDAEAQANTGTISQTKEWPLRFSWTARGRKSQHIDESERSSARRHSWNIWSQHQPRTSVEVDFNTDNKKAAGDVELSQVEEPSTRFSWSFRRESKTASIEEPEPSQQSISNDEASSSLSIMIDPSLFDEILGNEQSSDALYEVDFDETIDDGKFGTNDEQKQVQIQPS